MYEVQLMNNKSGEIFVKEIRSPYLLRIFLNKIQKGNKLTILSFYRI